MAEVRYGSSPDFSRKPGRRFLEAVERKFTLKGAKTEWLEKHQGRVENFKNIESQLTPEQRMQAAAKLDRDASRGALLNVGKNYLAFASILGTIVLGGRMAVDTAFRGRVFEQAGKLKRIKPREVIRAMSDRIGDFRNSVRTRGWAETLRIKTPG